jgi:hypothetical protein
MFHSLSFAKAWNDLLIMPVLLGFALLALRNPHGWAQAVLAGLLCSMKQYLLFLAPLLAIRLRLANAAREMTFAKAEGKYEYTIINDNLERAKREAVRIVRSFTGG